MKKEKSAEAKREARDRRGTTIRKARKRRSEAYREVRGKEIDTDDGR